MAWKPRTGWGNRFVLNDFGGCAPGVCLQGTAAPNAAVVADNMFSEFRTAIVLAGGFSHGRYGYLDAPRYILYGEILMEYSEGRLSDSTAHG